MDLLLTVMLAKSLFMTEPTLKIGTPRRPWSWLEGGHVQFFIS